MKQYFCYFEKIIQINSKILHKNAETLQFSNFPYIPRFIELLPFKRMIFFLNQYFLPKIIPLSFSTSNSKTFLVLQFLSKPILKSTFCCLRQSFHFNMEFSTRFPYSEMEHSHNFCAMFALIP